MVRGSRHAACGGLGPHHDERGLSSTALPDRRDDHSDWIGRGKCPLERTCAMQNVMSALTPKADMCSATRDVRFVPIADIRDLFDHLVGCHD